MTTASPNLKPTRGLRGRHLWFLWPEQAGADQQASEPGTHTVTLTQVAAQTGAYRVRANSNTANETGDYTLRVTAGPAPTGQLP